jgi:hypothetical protein
MSVLKNMLRLLMHNNSDCKNVSVQKKTKHESTQRKKLDKGPYQGHIYERLQVLEKQKTVWPD